MSGKKEMRHYPEAFRQQVRAEYEKGATQSALAKKYGVSTYSVESWCGLRPEVELRHAARGMSTHNCTKLSFSFWHKSESDDY